MSDITLRSQEFGQRSNLAYDAQKYESTRQMGGALQQLGQQIPEILHAQRMMDQRDVAIAHEHATQQAELQLSQEKLRFAMAIDGSDLSYENVRAARTQNDMAEQALKEQKRRFESADRNELKELNANLARSLAAAGDYKWELNPESGTWRERSEGEVEAHIEQLRESRTRLGSGGNEDVDRKRILNEIADLEDQFYASPKGSPEQAKWKRAMERAQSRYHALSERSTPGGAPSAGNSGATMQLQQQPQAPEKLSADDETLAGNVRGLLSAGSRVQGIVEVMAEGGDAMGMVQIPDKQVDAISEFLVRNKARIGKEMRKTQQNGRQWQGSDDDTVLRIANGLRRPGDPSYDSYIRMLVAAGLLPRESLK